MRSVGYRLPPLDPFAAFAVSPANFQSERSSKAGDGAAAPVPELAAALSMSGEGVQSDMIRHLMQDQAVVENLLVHELPPDEYYT